MDQKRIADALVRKCGTRDPFRIAEALGFEVVRLPLQGVRGFYQYMKRCKLIYIDSGLSDRDARFVCAHELGHAFLHQGYNRIFMDTHTHFVSSRYENQANRFAVDLLFDDSDLCEFMGQPIQVAADCMGVSVALASYRLGNCKIEY